MKGHSHTRSRGNTAVLTAVAVSAAFCVILYIQGELYGQCSEPTGVTTVADLQSYLQQFAARVDDPNTAESARNVTTALEQVVLNSTRLQAKDAEAAALQDKLTKTHQELAVATDSLRKLEDKVKQLEQQVKDANDEKAKSKTEAEQQQQAKQTELDRLKQEHEKLLKDNQELEKKQQTAVSPSSDQPAAAAAAVQKEDVVAAKFSALSVAGEQCSPVRDYEFWADPIVIWGYEHRAADAAECCAACHAFRRVVERGGTEQGRNSSTCNIWAFCGDKDKCKERFGECWLKHEPKLQEKAPPALPPNAQKSEGWISGAVYSDDLQLQQYNNTGLVFHTKLGDIQLDLLPDLAPTSVRELRRMAVLLALNGGYCSNCRIYRPEKGFLVQGVLEAPGAYVGTPRHPNPKQKMVMEKGLVCWAGGGGGPHWFVNMIDQSGFKDDHLCFAKASEESMRIFDKILELPLAEKKNPNDMNGLKEPLFYNMSMKVLKT